jgi:AcrR family transcriptional regulator
MPPGRRRRPERRDEILQAARTLLAERGFDGLTIRDLAQASGVTVQTLYNSFDGKEAIVSEAVEDLVDTRLGEAAQDGGRGLARLLLTLETPLGIIESTPGYSREVLRFYARFRPAAAQPITRSIRESILRAVMELRDDGLVAADVSVEAVTAALQFAMDGAIHFWNREQLDVTGVRQAMTFAVLLSLRSVATGPLERELDRRLKALERGPWSQLRTPEPAPAK